MTGETAPLQVLHLASGDGWGGAEVATLELLLGLDERDDVDVRAILLNAGELADRLRHADIAFEIVEEAGISFGALRRRVRMAAADNAWDVVHAHRYKEILLASTLRLRSRPRLIVTVHGAEPFADLDARSRLQIWGSLGLARLARARLAAVSPELATRLARVFGSEGVTRVDNPMPAPAVGAVDDLRTRFGWASNARLVGFVGRLEPVKGPDQCLAALELCPEEVCLVVIGGGSMAETLQHRVAQSPGLGRRVALMGETANPTRYFPQLDALALTSRHEGQPIVLLEAAAAALPVAAFAVGGVPELLRDAPGTWLVPPGDVARMAEVLTALVTDPGAARATARDWSVGLGRHHGRAAVVDRYVALYRGDPGGGGALTAAAAEPARPEA